MFTRLTALIEANHWVHTFFLGIWRLLPPRVIGQYCSAQILLVEHRGYEYTGGS